MNTLHILVIGAGSAGQRHARNLRSLGCRISACDPREDRLSEIAMEDPRAGKYTALPQALSAAEYDGFVIASPPLYHVSQALQVLACQRKWVLCEKPLSVAADQAPG